jgi:hypothetical protein
VITVKNMFLCSLVLTLLATAALPAFSAALEKQAKLVTLLKGDSGIISPESVSIKRGGTIVWYNRGLGPATIKFTTKLGIACAAPVNFYADLSGNYETSPVPEGGTASICLISEGEYNYTVTRLVIRGNKKPVEVISTGKVIVEK